MISRADPLRQIPQFTAQVLIDFELNLYVLRAERKCRSITLEAVEVDCLLKTTDCSFELTLVPVEHQEKCLDLFQ